MQKKRWSNYRTRRWLVTSISTLLLLLLPCWGLLRYLYPFLALNQRVENADLLVVEGWIDNRNLWLAREEFTRHAYRQMVVSSTSAPIVFIASNAGVLRFDFTKSPYKPLPSIREITLLAFGVSPTGTYPEFSLLVNDSVLIDRVQTSAQLGAYTYDLSAFEAPVANISVAYQTDSIRPAGSLYVHSLLVDQLTIPGWAHNVKYFKENRKSRKHQVWSTHFSDAEIARKIMLHYGMPEHQVAAVSASEQKLNRTFNSAEATVRWITRQYDTMPRINIFTEGVHARRSLMLYQLAFKDPPRLGVIAAPKYHYSRKDWWKKKEGREYVLVQALKYLYAKFLFYPYKEVSSHHLSPEAHASNNVTQP